MFIAGIGGALGILAGVAVLLGLFDPKSMGVEGRGASVPPTVAGIGIVAYGALGLTFAYGAWTRRAWGWSAGLALWITSGVSDAIGALLGFLPAVSAIAQVVIAGILSVYWFRPTVRAAFNRRQPDVTSRAATN
jgi:hypothetical protein